MDVFGVYDTDAKRTFISVKVDNVYTHECAKQMAIGTLNNSNATIAIAVTGNAMPLNPTHANQSSHKELGVVWIGVAGYNEKGEIICDTKEIRACDIKLDGGSIRPLCDRWIKTIENGINKTQKYYSSKYNTRNLTATVSQCIRYIVVTEALKFAEQHIVKFHVPEFIIQRKESNLSMVDGIHNEIPSSKYIIQSNHNSSINNILQSNHNSTINMSKRGNRSTLVHTQRSKQRSKQRPKQRSTLHPKQRSRYWRP
jgi:hypothetical protein